MDNRIVIDIGSYSIKVGFSNQDKPKYIIPSIIGRPRYLDLSKEISSKSHYVGNEAISKKGILALKYPIQYGLVTSWDDMELILNYIMLEQLNLNENNKDYSVIITDSPINTNSNREEITKVMFETFNIQNLYIGIQQEFAAQSIGLKNALIVDSGDTSTLIVPIINGIADKDSITLLKLGGKHITEYLFKLLNASGYNKINTYDTIIVNQFKEKFGFISLDYNLQIQDQLQEKPNESNIKLTDDKSIKFTNEHYKSTELLFNPSLNQLEHNGIQYSIYQTILKYIQDDEILNDLFSNIVLIGGNSKFIGFKERLENELKQLAHSTSTSTINNIKVKNTSEPIYSSWLGASLMDSDKFSSNCYTISDYDQTGPTIIYSNK